MPTPHEALRLFTQRERLRSFTRQPVRVREAVMADAAPGPAPPPATAADSPRAPFTYRWVTRAYALCPDCHAAIDGGRADILDHDRRRALLTCAAVAGLVAVMWFGFAPFTHNWIAAFWRNGAGGR